MKKIGGVEGMGICSEKNRLGAVFKIGAVMWVLKFCGPKNLKIYCGVSVAHITAVYFYFVCIIYAPNYEVIKNRHFDFWWANGVGFSILGEMSFFRKTVGARVKGL